jgi:hypothetical protein
MNKLSLLLIVIFCCCVNGFSSSRFDLLNTAGRITLLRVHDVGTAYGPPGDQVDVEVIVQLDTSPGKAYGFQLRNDNQRPAREGMLSLLREAFKNNWVAHMDYNITPGKMNGVVIRVWVTK